MELDSSEWELLRAGNPGVPSVPEWLCSRLPAGASVGFDPSVHSQVRICVCVFVCACGFAVFWKKNKAKFCN